MPKLPKSSVNLILTDLPYGTTQNKWDEVIPFDKMWECFSHVLTPTGIVVLTATQPFSSKLVLSNPKNFKYEIIWEKTIGSGQLNIKRQPLRVHESILIFYEKFGTYNEQKTQGEAYKRIRVPRLKAGYGTQPAPPNKDSDGLRNARSVIQVSNPRVKGGHPTQKPVTLMEYLIKTYSNPGDLVLDCCLGSGTTGIAAIQLDRNFIGIELDEAYFNIAKKRIEDIGRQ